LCLRMDVVGTRRPPSLAPGAGLSFWASAVLPCRSSRMSVSPSESEKSYYIPRVTCPQCGEHMRLARTEPLVPHNHHRMMFDCPCGFEYSMSERARLGG
jgi:hypothetical protein